MDKWCKLEGLSQLFSWVVYMALLFFLFFETEGHLPAPYNNQKREIAVLLSLSAIDTFFSMYEPTILAN